MLAVGTPIASYILFKIFLEKIMPEIIQDHHTFILIDGMPLYNPPSLDVRLPGDQEKNEIAKIK